MNCSTPGLPVYHQLLEFTQTHVRWVSDASNHLILCCPLLLPPSIFPNKRVFSNEPGGQNIGVSASTSVPPMNTQDWFPLGWTGWISFQSKGLSRVFSNITVQKHQFFGAQFSSVAQLCLTLCNPMDCSTPGFTVHHQLPELTQTQVHQVSDAI